MCLQELTARTLPVWKRLLREAGYVGISHGEPSETDRSRSLVVLTACRSEVERVPAAGVPWPERVLAVRVAQGLEVVNVHSPISPKPDLVKVRTHEAVHAHLTRSEAQSRRILCGDLNTPRKEHPDGRVWTFARDRFGQLHQDRDVRWDNAELGLIRGLEPYGFHDAFRSLHGLQRKEISWEWPRWPGGYRLDHMIVSDDIAAGECEYEHTWRKEKLSDHSALIARLAIA